MNETESEFIDVPPPPPRRPIFGALLLWVGISAAAWWIAFTFKPHSELVIKGTHVGVFFVWSLATFNLLRRQSVWRLGPWGQLIVSLLAVVTTELAQHWMPGHYPDWVGFGCSSLGVALAGFVRWRIDARTRARIQEQLDYDEQERQDYESASTDGNDFNPCAAPPAEWWPPASHPPNGEKPARIRHPGPMRRRVSKNDGLESGDFAPLVSALQNLAGDRGPLDPRASVLECGDGVCAVAALLQSPTLSIRSAQPPKPMKTDHVVTPLHDQNTPYVEPATQSLANRWADPEENRSTLFHWLHLPALRLGFSERKALLVAGDLAMLGGAWAAEDLMVRHRLNGENANFAGHWGWLVSLGVMWLVSILCTGACDLRVAASAWRSQWVASGAVLMTSAMYFFTPFVTPVLPERRLVLLVIPIIGTFGVSLWRLVYAKVIAQPKFRRRCLVIGAGWAARKLVHILTENPAKSNVPNNYAGYWIRGFVDDDAEKEGQCIGDIPVLGNSECLARLITEYRVDELILAITHLPSIQPRLFQAILACRERGVQVTSMAAVYELVTGRVPLEDTIGHLDVVMTLSTRRPSGFFLAGKRMLDILAGLGGCLLAILVAPLVWLANLLTSPGPLFFSQTRVGKKGNVFQVIKFRSMVPDAEGTTGGPVWARENDNRIKGVGRFLRRTRLDELPQCWNVLKGEMSLVGPRPERPEFVELLSRKIPFYRLRHGVKPGITGWAQVRYRYGASVEDSLVKVEYNLYYIKHQSMFIDWQILLESIKVVVRFQGR